MGGVQRTQNAKFIKTGIVDLGQEHHPYVGICQTGLLCQCSCVRSEGILHVKPGASLRQRRRT